MAGAHAVDHGLQHAEPVQLQLAREIARQAVSGQMQQQAGRRLRHRGDVRDQLLGRARARHHRLESQRAALGGRGAADGEQRQLAGKRRAADGI